MMKFVKKMYLYRQSGDKPWSLNHRSQSRIIGTMHHRTNAVPIRGLVVVEQIPESHHSGGNITGGGDITGGVGQQANSVTVPGWTGVNDWSAVQGLVALFGSQADVIGGSA